VIETISHLTNRIPFRPRLGVVLGTGLGGLVEMVESPTIIPYEEIPGFVRSTAPSHAGRMVAGTLGGAPVVLLQGRFHYYEGWTMQQVVYPVRVLAKLGVECLILTNAAGSLNEAMSPGAIVALEDHINLMGANPLTGPNLDEYGERFPSLHEPYCREYLDAVSEIAAECGITLHRGVYAAVAGPSLETRAECRMIRQLGADVVGMSTVPETIAAVHAGVRVLAFSVVSNYGNLFHSRPHTQEEIREYAARAAQDLQTLIIRFARRFD
jgi:purine-nucleoside phosphorylase